MVTHVSGLFIHPAQEWKKIRDTDESIVHVYFAHVLLLALIPPLSALIATTQIGWRIGNSDPVILTTSSALMMSGLMYLAMLAGVAIIGMFIKWMSRTYDSSPSLARCIVFSAYTATPLFVAGFTLFFPTPLTIILVGAAAVSYTAYLLYSGIATFMGIPDGEGFMFASSVLTVGLVMLVALMALTVVIWSFGFGPIYR